MRGLEINKGRVFFREDLPEPDPLAFALPTQGPALEETLVQIHVAGVCATDLALQAGYMDFSGVPGHEFVGTALNGPLKGQRVVGEINAACGTCAACAAGDDRHCPQRTVLGIMGRPGAFAERLCLPTRNLLSVPDEVPNDWAVFAEPLAAAFQIPAELDLPAAWQPAVQTGDLPSVCVVGDGRLGLLCAQVLSDAGHSLVLAGRHPERLNVFPEHLRARVQHQRGLFEADSDPAKIAGAFQLLVEATGSARVMAQALGAVAPRGTLVLKTTAAPSELKDLSEGLDLSTLVVNEIRLVGSRCGRFEPALEALAAGRIQVEPMIEARYPLSEGPQAFERAAQRGTCKVLLDIS